MNSSLCSLNLQSKVTQLFYDYKKEAMTGSRDSHYQRQFNVRCSKLDFNVHSGYAI